MANMNFGVNILPKANNTYSLGNSDYKWNLYTNSINGTTIDNLVLPTVSSTDNGKILKVDNGAWAVGAAPSGLPSVSSTDNGKMLQVSNGAWAAVAYTAPVTSVNGNTGAVTTTDEKVKYTDINGENSGKGILLAAGLLSNGNSSTGSAYSTNKLVWNDSSATLYIYNSNKSQYGRLTSSQIVLTDSSTGYSGTLQTDNITEARRYKLPNTAGTIALTSDIPDVSGFYTKPSGGIPAADLAETYLTSHQDISGKANSADLATVATTGDYDDLLNKPTIPAADDHKWNNVSLTKNSSDGGGADILIPFLLSTSATSAELIRAGDNPVAKSIPLYTTGGYLRSTTPSANDNSTKVATTAYVDAAIPDVSGFYTKPSGGIPATDLAETYLTSHQDISGLAPKANPVFTGSISMGRVANSTVGTNSVAEGYDVTASGDNSHAEGYINTASGTAAHAEGRNTTASGNYSHAEGYYATASGSAAHAEGYYSTASNSYSHAEGRYTTASGAQSHAEGEYTVAEAQNSHVSGMYNVADSYDNWSEWVANTSYEVGDKVKRTDSIRVTGYICKTANSDSTFTSSKWINHHSEMNYAEIIGNGTADNARSNARALDWDGNEWLKGNLYVGCNTDSTGGSKVATESYVTGLKGVNNGLAELDSSGKVPSSQLPSYVDDVEEYNSTSDFPETGESSKIYIALDTNKTYRWGGSEYVPIGSDLALGETSSTAYRGDRGAAAYAAAVTNVETTPTSASTNLITSGGVYTALGDYAPKASPVFTGSISLGRAPGTIGTNSFAVGSSASATGQNAHAEGENTLAQGNNSHAEGYSSDALAVCSHAEGYDTTAGGNHSHAEGNSTSASGLYSHAEGLQTTVNSSTGAAGHAEGYGTVVDANYAHAEGQNTTAAGTASHTEGMGGTVTYNGTSYASGARGIADHVEGYQCLTLSSQPGNHAEGYLTKATGGAAHAEGTSSLASGSQSHAEGTSTTASGAISHAEGSGTTASGAMSHAEGYSTVASGTRSHAEGYGSTYTVSNVTYQSGAKGDSDHSEGYQTIADSGSDNYAAHAEGYQTRATSNAAHAEGILSVASGYCSHAEGNSTTASASYSHAEGSTTTASGEESHAEGYNTTASGHYSHAEGHTTIASKPYAHAEGHCTIAQRVSQHVFGEYNIADTSSISLVHGGLYAEIVGNGLTDSTRSNARTLDWGGNERLMGQIYVGCNADSTGGTQLVPPIGMTGATSSTAGTAGYVPAPSAGDDTKFLRGDGTWGDGGLPMVILSYGNSTWADFEAAYNNNVIVYCRASSNSNPASGSQTRMAFMAYVNNSTTPTEVEFQYYRSMSSHSATAMGDQVFVYKLTKTGGWSVTTRDASIKEINVASGSKLEVSWSGNKVTLSNTMTAADMPMSSSDSTTVSATISALSTLPAVTSADNGKILRVVNGEWAVVSISDASGVSF